MDRLFVIIVSLNESVGLCIDTAFDGEFVGEFDGTVDGRETWFDVMGADGTLRKLLFVCASACVWVCMVVCACICM